MLDNCSQATLMRNNFLVLHGRKASITVKTMNSEMTKSLEVLNGIEAAYTSKEREEKVWVKLPGIYTGGFNRR